MSVGTGLGLIIGVVIGVLTDNIGLGLALGLGFGASVETPPLGSVKITVNIDSWTSWQPRPLPKAT